MKGKDKCKILKEIRAEIARANDIAWVTENCTHKGECRGTCPKCEAEVLTLERALARRRALGKTVAVVGLSAGMIATAASCEAYNDLGNAPTDGDMDISVAATTMEIAGGMAVLPETGAELNDVLATPGEPVPVYYTADFKLYEYERLFRAIEEIYLYEVQEENEDPDELYSIPADDDFQVAGESESMGMILVRYKGKLYAIDRYDMEERASEYIAVDD